MAERSFAPLKSHFLSPQDKIARITSLASLSHLEQHPPTNLDEVLPEQNQKTSRRLGNDVVNFCTVHAAEVDAGFRPRIFPAAR
jgi:hypothetical protein